MKSIKSKFKTVLFLLLAFTLSNCSSDDSVANQAPNSFNLIEVPDGATDVDLQPQLSWEVATDPDGDVINYNLYIGTENPPTNEMASGLTTTYYNIQDSLNFGATYYWKVIATDNQGNSIESNVASFSIRSQTVQELLAGKWFLESIAGEAPITECQKQGFYQFSENGTFLGMGFGLDNNGDCISTGSSTGTYLIINNNQIDVITSGSNDTLQIISLTNEEFIFGFDGIIATMIKE